MDIEMIILLAAIAVGLGLAGYKTYKKLMADGKMTTALLLMEQEPT